MSYAIRYDTVYIRQEAVQKKVRRKRIWILAALGIVLIGMLPYAGELLCQFFFPGSGGETICALEKLAQQVGEGEPIGEAIYAFCQQVVAQGQ